MNLIEYDNIVAEFKKNYTSIYKANSKYIDKIEGKNLAILVTLNKKIDASELAQSYKAVPIQYQAPKAKVISLQEYEKEKRDAKLTRLVIQNTKSF